MFHILIVEDEEGIREELMLLLQNALYRVSCITRFENIAEQIRLIAPDLVLLDMNLPGEDGLSVCGELRHTTGGDIPIIFVTANNTSMDELNCMLKGGDDYVSKPYTAPVLLARIAAVLKRTVKQETDNSVFECRGTVLDLAKGTVSHGGKSTELSKNELKILYYLFTNQEKIVAREELIDFLWDNQLFIDDNALSVNITRIRGKLESIGVMDLIETRRGMGYRI